MTEGQATEKQTAETNPAKDRLMDRIAARFQKTGRTRTAPPAANHPPARKPSLLKRMATSAAWAAALGASYVGAIYATGTVVKPMLDRDSAENARVLTAGEQAVVQALFGSNFATNNVTLYFHDTAPDHALGTKWLHNNTIAYVNRADPNNVHFIRPYFNTPDLTGDVTRTELISTFVHEMVHVWQNRQQNRAASCENYEYTLTPQSRLEDFCTEQQAEIIADYATKYLISDYLDLSLTAPSYLRVRSQGFTFVPYVSDEDRQLMRVVESALPHAQSARLHIASNNQITLSCTFNTFSAAHPNPIQGMPLPHTYMDAFNACAARHLQTLDGRQASRDITFERPGQPGTTRARPAPGFRPVT